MGQWLTSSASSQLSGQIYSMGKVSLDGWIAEYVSDIFLLLSKVIFSWSTLSILP